MTTTSSNASSNSGMTYELEVRFISRNDQTFRIYIDAAKKPIDLRHDQDRNGAWQTAEHGSRIKIIVNESFLECHQLQDLIYQMDPAMRYGVAD
jgi:hypothetical protein